MSINDNDTKDTAYKMSAEDFNSSPSPKITTNLICYFTLSPPPNNTLKLQANMKRIQGEEKKKRE